MKNIFLILLLTSTLIAISCSKNPTASLDQTILNDNSNQPIGALPTITDSTDLTIDQDTSSLAIPITITDIDDTLSCTASLNLVSSNTSLINSSNVVFAGTAPNCTAVLTPNVNQRGLATLRFTVSDGSNTVQSSNFNLTVNLSVAAALAGHDTKLWLDGADILGNGSATADGSALTAWNDKSGNNNHLTGTGGANYNLALRAAQFNNTAQPFTGSYATTTSNSLHIFLVPTSGATVDNNMFFETSTPRIAIGRLRIAGGGTDLSNNLNWSSGNLVGQEIVSLEYLSNGSQLSYRNGSNDHVENQAVSFTAIQSIYIGDDSTGGNRCQNTDFLHEVIIINNDLSSAERQAIEGALACKWGLQSLLPTAHPYKSTCY